MSGKRRISVDEAQWNVLQRQARQLDDLRVNAPKLVADVQRQTQSELARVSERLSGRQQAVERTVSALSEQTRALEADTSRRLREQASEMRQQLADTAGQLRAETSAALARQQQAWRSELAAERDRQRAELARLESEIRRDRPGLGAGRGDLAERRRAGPGPDQGRASARALRAGRTGRH